MSSEISTISDKLDPEDSKTARRSLLTATTLTLLVPNIDFLSDKFTLFDLSLGMSQEKVIALGQISTTTLLLIFVLKETKTLVLWRRAKAARKLRLEQNEIERDLLFTFGWEGDYRDYSDDPAGEIEELSDRQSLELKKLEARYEIIENSVDTFTETILKYTLPILFSIIAILKPEALSYLVQAISEL